MRRKEKPINVEDKRLIIAILAVIIVCVLITAGIIANLTRDKEDTESQSNTTSAYFENAYVYQVEDGQVHFCYGGEQYAFESDYSESYKGIADISVKNQRVYSMVQKPDLISGNLLSYTDEAMEVENYGMVKRISNVPVYHVFDTVPTEGGFSDFVLGESLLSYVMQENCIVSILVTEKTIPEKIRVLIKNGTEDIFSNVTLAVMSKAFVTQNQVTTEYAAGDIAIESLFSEGVEEVVIDAGAEGCKLKLQDGKDTQPYPDVLKIKKHKEGYLVINETSLEEYVKRVIPSEMPSKFEVEALKAQAVCARTYALSQIHNTSYAEYGANMDDTTSFQVYNMSPVNEKILEASKSTQGQTLMQNNAYITCFFFSTSAGVTTDMGVWENQSGKQIDANDYAYITSANPIGNIDFQSEKAMTKYLKEAPECYDAESPYFRWKAELENATDEVVGKIRRIDVIRRESGGYVSKLCVYGEKESKMVEGELAIRQYLGAFLGKLTLSNGTERTDMKMLPSSCFVVEEGKNGSFLLLGGGFGHGIGMSQFGANGMAKQGKDYLEILNFYYRNFEINMG